MWQRNQLKQTIISTGCIGAMFGALPVLGLMVFRSDYTHATAPSRTFIYQAVDLSLLFFGCVLFCIVVFGLLPMSLQYGFIWLVRRWTGRD